MSPWTVILLLLGHACLPAAELRLGRAAVKITPPAGIPLAGSYSIRLADGAHDDLYAKAIVIEKDGVKAALVACDLVSLERPHIEEARRLVEKSTGLRGDNVMISATHTHTGPLLLSRFLAYIDGQPLQLARQYGAALPARIAGSVRLAEANLAPARLRAGIGREDAVSFYRRFLMKDGTVKFNPGKGNPDIVQPMGSIDPDVGVLLFEALDGKPLATYVNFALHLDTVGGQQYSADFPFTLAKLLGKIQGPDMLTLFTIGCAGNINHIDVRSREPQKGHAEARRIGTILAGEVIKTWTRLRPVPDAPLRVRSKMVQLPKPSFPPEEVRKAKSALARFGKPDAPAFLDLVHAMKVLDVDELNGRPLEAEVQVIAVGDRLAWVGLPGEIFVELGVAIKKASPFPVTIVAELANGWISYVPTRKAFSEGAYEVLSARCASGGGEMLADAAIRLLAELHRTSKN